MNLVFVSPKSNLFDLPIDAGFRFWFVHSKLSTSRRVIAIQEDFLMAQELLLG
jgi:hypothetical protein